MKMQTTYAYALLLACAVLLAPAVALAQNGYEIGDKVADFQLKSTAGKMVSLADYQDAKGIVVVFSCNTCPIVKYYEDRMISTHKAYADKGFPFLLINSNDPKKSPGDSFEKMQDHAKKMKYPFTYVFDETQAVAKKFKATNTPQVYLLTKKGNDWVLTYTGAIDDSPQSADNAKKHYLKDAIEAVLAGKEVKTQKTKAVGCTIKFS
jgi:peroxiredoxin